MWRLERAVHCSENRFPCHMTSVGYIATFHMAAPIQAAVFMKILLILARSLPGAGGCMLVGLCPVWLTRGSWEDQLLHRCLRGRRISSSGTGTSAYMAQFQNFRCLVLSILTGGDSRLGVVGTPVWQVLGFLVALAKPFY